MPFRNTPLRYGYVAVTLHWMMALLVIGMLCLGLYMTGLSASLEKLKLYGLHKSFGVLILMLVTIRLAWRFSSIIPALPSTLATWQKIAAHVSHVALYACLFIMPLSGWLMSVTAGIPVSFFGLFLLPAPFAADHPLHVFFLTLHQWCAFVLIGLICIHIGAALQHHFIYKDTILKRMLPW
jgi:cytochrome b561